MKSLKKILWGISLPAGALILSYLTPAPAMADTLVSPHYQFTEQSLGSSGLYGSQSANYQSEQAIGILGLSTSASTNIQVEAGNVTTGDPALTFIVNSPSADFGEFSAGAAATATATFSVINYTSFGYIVQVYGNPPTGPGGHSITAMSSTGTSVPGIEQYGINLVANTSPVSLGANPTCTPSADFCPFSDLTDLIDANYKTSDNYRYVSGETIAQAPKSTGQVNYTISYMVNVAALTPGGRYDSNQVLICTGTY
jgi:hypothetical protein